MTLDEAVEKYWKIELLFHSYYKYSFSYSGWDDIVDIYASYGWDSDSIYRYEVWRDSTTTIGQFMNYIEIKNKQGDVIFSYNNY